MKIDPKNRANIVFGAFLGLIASIVVVSVIMNKIPEWEAEIKLKKEVAQTNTDLKQELIRLERIWKDGITPHNDVWGNEFKYSVNPTPDRIFFEVSSIGPDQLEDSADDISDRSTDLNKSKIVGKWMGQKFKAAASGVIEGLKPEKKVVEEVVDEVTEDAKKTKKWWQKIF